VLVAAAGAYPAWLLRGESGLWEELAGGASVLWATLVCGLTVLAASRRGARRAAMTFIAGGLVAGVAALIAAGVVAAMTPLRALHLVLWVGVFFFPMILAESLWLARALHRGMRR